jgi:hypothetical protein
MTTRKDLENAEKTLSVKLRDVRAVLGKDKPSAEEVSRKEQEILADVSVNQHSIAAFLGVAPRTVERRADVPRNKDRTYPLLKVWEWDRTTYRPKETGEDGELKSLKLQVEIEKRQEERDRLRRERHREQGQLVPLREVVLLLGAIRTLSIDASRRAERNWGEDGKEFYAELWGEIGKHFGELVGGSAEYVLCERAGKLKRLTPVKFKAK